MDIIKNKKIAIIGGGPVGLTTARLLQVRGANVTVFERDKNQHTRISGGTLDIHAGTGQSVLQEAGLLDAYFENSRCVGERLFDMWGNLKEDEIPTEETKYSRPEIDRKDLRKIILDVLEPGTVIWDKHFDYAEQQGEQYRLHFKDGYIEVADLVIAADGGKSKLRSLITDVQRIYTGTIALQCEIRVPQIACPAIYKMVNNGNMAALGERKVISIQTKSDGSFTCYLAFRQQENWFRESGLNLGNHKQVINFLQQSFSQWHPVFHELFTASEEFIALPLYRIPLEKQWDTYDNIALVGDAAHLMPPSAGVGVNIGLLDALNLANNLTSDKFSTLGEAIKDYAFKMFGYAREAQEHTMLSEIAFHDVEP